MTNQKSNELSKLNTVYTLAGYFLADDKGNRYPNRLTAEQASSPAVREAAYHYLYSTKGAPVIGPETERLRAELEKVRQERDALQLGIETLSHMYYNKFSNQTKLDCKQCVSTHRAEITELKAKLEAAKKIIAQQADTIRAVQAAVLPHTEEC